MVPASFPPPALHTNPHVHRHLDRYTSAYRHPGARPHNRTCNYQSVVQIRAKSRILESAIFVRRSRRLDDVRRRCLANSQVEKFGDGGGIQDIPRVNESF